MSVASELVDALLEGGITNPRNVTYVCFTCRNARKHYPQPEGIPGPRCPTCKNEMRSIGHRTEIPGKDDVAGWESLFKRFNNPSTTASRRASRFGRDDHL